MAFGYSKTANAANKLLKKFGQSVTLKHVTPGTYVPGTGQTGTGAVLQTGTGAVVDWDARQVDGTLIQTGDKRLLLSPLNTAGTILTAITLGDTVTDVAGVIYTLVAPLKTVSPAGTAVLYDCNLRV